LKRYVGFTIPDFSFTLEKIALIEILADLNIKVHFRHLYTEWKDWLLQQIK